MLEEIRLRDFGIVPETALDLGPGLVAITGETGAGKTMVNQALVLLIGARADASYVRSGATRAVVEGRFRASPAVVERAADLGGELDEGSLIVTRTVAADGRSRAYVGGAAVPAGALNGVLGDRFVIHAQTDQIELLKKAAQRDALDRFAGVHDWDVYREYQAGFRQLAELAAEIENITTRSRERAREADMLRHGLAEIRRADPKPDELDALAEERDRLAHADTLRAAVSHVHGLLAEDGGALDTLGVAVRSLEGVRSRDPALAEIADRLADAFALTSDATTCLASYDVEVDPEQLESINERIALLRGLTRKYGSHLAEVLEWQETATARLSQLDDDDERLAKITSEITSLRARLGELATAVSKRREEAGKHLAADVTSELRALAMADAKLIVQLDRNEDPDGISCGDGRYRFGAHGVDDVTYLLCPHRGGEPRPVARAASGGELSRIMLALELVLADAHPVETFVFDEVDAGVGGEAAAEIGKRLARLSKRAQVIVVTHLPQIAAFADTHVVVTKRDGAATARVVDGPERVRELSRMLAGRSDSELAHGHAEELLAAAASHNRIAGASTGH